LDFYCRLRNENAEKEIKIYNIDKERRFMMVENFNVGNLTKENVDYAFKNLVFYVNASLQLDIYKAQKESFEKVLVKVNDILATYVNEKSLTSISEEKLQDIRFDLIDLDVETKSLESYFTEWSLLWLDAIISLRNLEIKLGGANDGR
jgi:hypothetical protein